MSTDNNIQTSFEYSPDKGGMEICGADLRLVFEIQCTDAKAARKQAILNGGGRGWTDVALALLNQQPNVSDEDLLGYVLAVAGKHSGPVIRDDGVWVFWDGVQWTPGESVIRLWNTVYGRSWATAQAVDVEMMGGIYELKNLTTKAHRQAYASAYNEVKAHVTRMGEEARAAMKRGLTPAAYRALKR